MCASLADAGDVFVISTFLSKAIGRIEGDVLLTHCPSEGCGSYAL